MFEPKVALSQAKVANESAFRAGRIEGFKAGREAGRWDMVAAVAASLIAALLVVRLLAALDR